MSKYIIGLLLVLAVAIVGLPEAVAHPEFLNHFNEMYGTAGTRLDTCYTCHIPGGTKAAWNPYGMAVHEALAALGDNHELIGVAISNVEPLDSDGDTYINIDEITALTFPGDASDYPGVTPPPVATATVTFIVKDSVTGLAIQGASVKLEGSGKSVKTDYSGAVVFTDVTLGDYNYVVRDRGYIRYANVVSVAGDTIVTIDLALR